MAMEIQLQLDGNGRTIKTSGENSSNEASVAIDFSSKTVMTLLVPPTSTDGEAHDEWQAWMDNVLFDCEISDCGLMPRTFWMAADGTKPRCVLEQMALDVFHHHLPKGFEFDPSTSGAEWWVQIRPSPPNVGRYSMHDPQSDGMSTTGISFHWDKDEDLRLLAGGSLYVHPYLSTVTYLTDLGAPTMVVDCRVNCTSGEWIVPQDRLGGFVSWPKQGKHLSFDGRLLHAAPPDLMENGWFEQQCKIAEEEYDGLTDVKERERRRKILERRHRRVTFLVNVWLNYKPFNVDPFPETMIDKLTKIDNSMGKMFPMGSDSAQVVSERCVIVNDCTVSDETSDADEDNIQAQTFTWPMGDCGSSEIAVMQMPLSSIRQEAAVGGNVRIVWKQGTDSHLQGVRLCKSGKPLPSVGDETAAQKKSDNDSSVSADLDNFKSSAKRMKVERLAAQTALNEVAK